MYVRLLQASPELFLSSGASRCVSRLCLGDLSRHLTRLPSQNPPAASTLRARRRPNTPAVSFFHSSALAPQALSCLMLPGHLPAGPPPIPRSQGELTSSKLPGTRDIPGEFQRFFPLRGSQGDVRISRQEQVSSRICFSSTFCFRAPCSPFHVIHTSQREPAAGR